VMVILTSAILAAIYFSCKDQPQRDHSKD